ITSAVGIPKRLIHSPSVWSRQRVLRIRCLLYMTPSGFFSGHWSYQGSAAGSGSAQRFATDGFYGQRTMFRAIHSCQLASVPGETILQLIYQLEKLRKRDLKEANGRRRGLSW